MKMTGRLKQKLAAMGRYLIMPAIILAAAGILLISVGNVSKRQEQESLKQLQDAIQRAVLNCYAIEGSYPATIEYIEDYYGLQIDHDKYEVFYEIFADNIMPEITVVEK